MIALATDASIYVTAWLNSLSRTRLTVLRTPVLFVPAFVAVLAAVAAGVTHRTTRHRYSLSACRSPDDEQHQVQPAEPLAQGAGDRTWALV